MEVLQNGRDDHNPKKLLKEAQNWLEVYGIICASHQNVKLIYQSLYSFFFAVELYLKAYIVSQDHEYANSAKLKKLKHNFQEMRRAIQQTKDKELRGLLKNQFNSNRLLLRKDWSEFLRYVPSRMMISIERDMEKGVHDWEPLFLRIESIIDQQYDQWEHDHYPKKEDYSVAFSMGAPKDDKALNKISSNILKICPGCRSKWVIAVIRNINYPWTVKQKIVKCKVCRKEFVLKESWLRDL